MSKTSRRPRAGRRAPAGLRLLVPDDGAAAALLAVANVTGDAELPMLLSWRAFRALVGERGGHHEAWAFAVRLANESGKPVFVNGQRADCRAGSSTVAIPPADPASTPERLNGFVAGFKGVIEAEFSDVDGPPSWPGRAA